MKKTLKQMTKEKIRELINIEDMEVLPSERNLVDLLQVSRITVRGALRELVEDGKITPVQGKGYVVKHDAGKVNSGRISIVMNRLLDHYEHDLLFELENYCRKLGYELNPVLVDPDHHAISDRISKILDNSDKIVFSGGIVKADSIYDVLKGRENDCVIMGQSSFNNFPLNYVRENVEQGFKKLAAHLGRQGHKNIAYIGYLNDEQRIKGIKRGFSTYGLELNKDLMVNSYGFRHSGFEAAAELLKRNKKFTAVICQNDLCALGVMEQLFMNGIKIPDDISVVGFDDVSEASKYPVPLTTAGGDKVAMSKQVVDVLTSNNDSFKEILMDVKVCRRKSTIKPKSKI